MKIFVTAALLVLLATGPASTQDQTFQQCVENAAIAATLINALYRDAIRTDAGILEFRGAVLEQCDTCDASWRDELRRLANRFEPDTDEQLRNQIFLLSILNW